MPPLSVCIFARGDVLLTKHSALLGSCLRFCFSLKQFREFHVRPVAKLEPLEWSRPSPPALGQTVSRGDIFPKGPLFLEAAGPADCKPTSLTVLVDHLFILMAFVSFVQWLLSQALSRASLAYRSPCRDIGLCAQTARVLLSLCI